MFLALGGIAGSRLCQNRVYGIFYTWRNVLEALVAREKRL